LALTYFTESGMKMDGMKSKSYEELLLEVDRLRSAVDNLTTALGKANAETNLWVDLAARSSGRGDHCVLLVRRGDVFVTGIRLAMDERYEWADSLPR
jgi:hypothetical protein